MHLIERVVVFLLLFNLKCITMITGQQTTTCYSE